MKIMKVSLPSDLFAKQMLICLDRVMSDRIYCCLQLVLVLSRIEKNEDRVIDIEQQEG